MKKLFVAISITLFSFSPVFADPLKFEHYDSGENSPVGAGHHVWSRITISDNCKMNVEIEIHNKVALNGYCVKPFYYLLDEKNNMMFTRFLGHKPKNIYS